MRSSLLILASFALVSASVVGCGDNATHPVDRPAFDSGDAQPLSCVPNLDGRIDSSELTPALGVPVNFLINPIGKERIVDVVGTIVAGQRVWNFGIDFADDARITLLATAATGKWYAGSFPSGQFTAPLDAAGTLEGIYRHDDASLTLLGIASTKPDGPEGKTLLIYDVPIPIVRFPLAAGAKWIASGTVINGTIRNLPYAGKDVYEVEDVATGKLVLHDLTFQQVHRVNTRVTVSPSAGVPTSHRQVSFFTECFGEVARATSKNEETNPDFTSAAELRRFGN